MSCKVITLGNAKGGTGKTLVAANLSLALSMLRFRVLAIDLDPQGHLAVNYGITPWDVPRTSYEMLTTSSPNVADYLLAVTDNLYFIGNQINSELETKLEAMPNREMRLSLCLEEVKDQFDFIVIDTQPVLRTPTLNGVLAADDLLVVVDCGNLANYGLLDFKKKVEETCRSHFRPPPVMRGLLNNFEGGNKVHPEIYEDLREFFGERMLKTIIRHTVEVSRAAGARQAVILNSPSSMASRDIKTLVIELSKIWEKDASEDVRPRAAALA